MDGYATHQPLLIYAALHTKGPILELGAGDYSTPILHAIGAGRHVVTLESDAAWLSRFGYLRASWHQLCEVASDDWPAAIRSACQGVARWGLVFVDQKPSTARGKSVRQLHALADVFVCHDTQVRHGPEWGGALEEFGYTCEIRHGTPWTAAVSDVLDVSQWPQWLGGEGDPCDWWLCLACSQQFGRPERGRCPHCGSLEVRELRHGA